MWVALWLSGNTVFDCIELVSTKKVLWIEFGVLFVKTLLLDNWTKTIDNSNKIITAFCLVWNFMYLIWKFQTGKLVSLNKNIDDNTFIVNQYRMAFLDLIAFYKTNMNSKYQKTDTVEKCVILSSPTCRDGLIWMMYYCRMTGWWAIGKNTPRARNSNRDELTLSTFWIQDQNDAKSTEGCKKWSVDMLSAPRFLVEAMPHVTECQVNKLACVPMKFFTQLPSRIDATRLSTS